MTGATSLTKAQLWKLDANGDATSKFDVQFNPESLKVTFTNQMQPADQNAQDNQHGTAATQFVGRGSSKLAVTLWFDVTADVPATLAETDDQRKDVRKLTEKVIDLIRVDRATAGTDQAIPPAVSFVWGTFKFDGLVESIEQSLDFFSPQGVPLRASMNMNLTRQSIDYGFQPGQATPSQPGAAASLPSGAAPGTTPLAAAPAGATVQSMAAAAGKGADWQAIAAANGIENPRLLSPGQLLDLNVPLTGAGLTLP